MRFNDKELAILSQRSGQLEGRLQYRGPSGTFRDSSFRERYFRLVNNLLFYFRLNEVGQIDFKEPVGVIVLENYSVRVEQDSELSFAFAIIFLDEPSSTSSSSSSSSGGDKRHLFTSRSDLDVNKWVMFLRQASYQHWKERLQTMEKSIKILKNKESSKKNVIGSATGVLNENFQLFPGISALSLNPSSVSGNSGLSTSPRQHRQQRYNPFLPVSTERPIPPPRSPAGSRHKINNESKTNNNEHNIDLIKF